MLYALRMTHRLLHTLVFSSAALVGCGATHAMPLQSDAPSAPDAGSDAPDVRYCEPGWPTTKGQFRHVVGETTYSCPHTTTMAAPDLSVCCVVRPEDVPPENEP